MRFIASAKYEMYARAAVKMVSWRIYARKTSALSDSLASGTWVEVTSRIIDPPPAEANLEWEIGYAAASSMSFTARGIAWWKANVFNASASEYVEFKIIFTLGLGTDVCTDLVYTFSGFADKTPEYDELSDSLNFTVLTAQDIGSGFAAENISAQYVNADIDGYWTAALYLPEIPMLYLKSANITDYILKAGSHTIGFRYTSGPDKWEAALDSGAWVVLSNGDNTLGNAAASADDTERVTVYVTDTTKLSKPADDITDTILVVTEADTLPRNWYRFASVRSLLERCLTKIGIGALSQTFDTLEMDTADGDAKVSFLDAPPNDDTIMARKWALVSDGTDLWMGVGNRLYKRTMTSGEYTLKATLGTGRVISRLWYDSSGGYVWVYSQQSETNTAGKVLRHKISDATNSSEITLSNSTRYAIAFYSSWPGIVYVNQSTHAIRGVDSSTLTEQLIFSAATLGYTGSNGPSGNHAFERSSKLYFQADTLTNTYLHGVYYAAGWYDDGQALTLTAAYEVGAFDSSENRIYFHDVVNAKIKSHTYSSAAETDILTLSGQLIESMQYVNGKTYFTAPASGHLYELDSNVATNLTPDGPRVYTRYFAFAYLGKLYGLDEAGRLYQYATTLSLYVKLADFSGETIIGAFNALLNAFQLLGTISSTKQALVYRRADSTGALKTTGNVLSLTISDASEIKEMVEYVPACGFAEVENGVIRFTYNGSIYNAETLSDVRRFSLSSSFIPDEIVKDLCKHVYQFYKTARTMYMFELGYVPLFQYEPCDGLSVTFTTTKIQKTSAAGVIYGTVLAPDGSMQVRGMF